MAAHLLTQKDVYAVMNALVEDLTGQQATVRAVDTSSYINCGETVLAYGTENILNSLTLLVGRIMVASRPYAGSFNLINAIETGIYTHRMQKVSFYSKGMMPEGAWNTDLFTNIKTGFTNGQNKDEESGDPQSTKSMWEQNLAVPVVENFSGSDVFSTCITIPSVQIEQALRSPDEMNSLISGMLTEHENDINLAKEAFRRSIVLDHAAAVYDMEADGLMPGSVVNLVEEFNTRYGTNYSYTDLMSTYYKEFIAFSVALIKRYQRMLTYKTSNYHWTPANEDNLPLLRHTPRELQRLFMLNKFYIDAEAMVFPELFNDEELKVQFEGVEFWQNQNEPEKISIYPAVPDPSTGAQSKGDLVETNLIGILFDRDAMMSDFQMDRAASTPEEARKLYRNIWMHVARNGISSLTENCVIFVAEDPT